MELNDVMTQGSYFIFNKIIAREYGFDSAVLLGELFNRYKMYSDANALVDGMFYLKRKTIAEDIGMSPDRQRTALNKLTKAKLVVVKRKGNPSRNYYYVDVNKINETIEKSQSSEKPTTSGGENRRLVVGKTDDIINNKYINNYTNKEYYKWNSSSEFDAFYPSKEVLVNQIIKCCDSKGVSDSCINEILYIITYYFDMFEYHFKKQHVALSNKALSDVIDALTNEDEIVLDHDDYETLIDQHFATDYKDCDYNICHFVSGDIRYLRYCEILK